MAPTVEQALRDETEVLITTFDAGGKPGAVPIWFVYHDGKVYMATGRESVKTRKLRLNPRVRLSFGGGRPALEGTGRVCEDEAVIRSAAPVLNARYNGAWGPDEDMIARLVDGDTVLLEIEITG